MRLGLLWAVLTLVIGCKDSDADGTRDKVDCAPQDPTIFPGAEEVCDGQDNDCNGQIDEDVAIVAYWDRDRDGFGDPAYVRRVCTLPEDSATVGGDCDDLDPSIYPDAPEQCDGVDNDCDDEVDEDAPNTFYLDSDGDGHGVTTETIQACIPPEGFVSEPDDCDDSEPEAWEGRPEQCDGVDNDCNGQIDEGLEPTRQWTDADGDGYGDPDHPVLACGPGPGVADNPLDCDDGDPGRSLDGREVRNNNIDDDCDDYVDEFGVGPNSEFATAEDALSSAPSGSVIQLDDGFHVDTIDLTGHDVTLAGEGCERTTLYGDAQGTTIIADGGRIENLTVSGGTGTLLSLTEGILYGGGVLVLGGEVTIAACVEANAAGRGGGIAVVGGTTRIEHAVIANNASSDYGGGIYARAPATIEIHASRILANTSSTQGGGLALTGSSATVTNTVLASNRVLATTQVLLRGGGLMAQSWTDEYGTITSPTVILDQTTFHDNGTDPANTTVNTGEAIYATAGTVEIHNGLFTGHANPFVLLEEAGGQIEPNFIGFRGNVGTDVDFETYYPERIAGEPGYVLVDPTLPTLEWDFRLGAGSDLLDAGDPTTFDRDGSIAQLGAYGGPLAPDGWDFGVVTDDDADGMLDAWEIRWGTNPYIDDAGADPDGDGLIHADEFALDADPLDPDTDADGIFDGVEDGLLNDPNDPRDHAPVPEVPEHVLAITGEPVQLDAATAYDPNGDALTVTWGVVTLPPTSSASISAPNAIATSITPDVAGTYELELTVDDGGTARTQPITVVAWDGIIVPDDEATIQEAVDASIGGFAVGIRPGTWVGPVHASGQDVVLVGLGTRNQVIVDGGGAGSVLAVDDGALTMGHLTITGGFAFEGGGVRISDATIVDLTDVSIVQNRAYEGGGLWVHGFDAEMLLRHCAIDNNVAVHDGGGLWLMGEDIKRTLIVEGGRFTGNTAGAEGGAMWLDGGVLSGDADFFIYSTVFADNEAQSGALWHATGQGMDLNAFNITAIGNRGGSLSWGDQGRILVMSDLLARNAVDILFDGDDGTSTVDYRHFYGVWTDLPDTIWFEDVGTAGDITSWVEDNPRVGAFIDNGDPSDDLWMLRGGSLAFDGGFIDMLDRDGSRADMGACGGLWSAAGCNRAWVDNDRDGMADGWEAAVGLDPLIVDVFDDLDGDGLNNQLEHQIGTRPDRADTDGDGVDDATEATNGKPLDDRDHRPIAIAGKPVIVVENGDTALLDARASYDPDGEAINSYTWRVIGATPGSNIDDTSLVGANTPTMTFVPDAVGAFRIGLVVSAAGIPSREVVTWVVVPDMIDVPATADPFDEAIDEAIDEAKPFDIVQLEAGTFPAQLQIESKPITIAGAGPELTILEAHDAERVLYVTIDDHVTLRDLTLTGGANVSGGAVYCSSGTLSLQRVTLRQNTARLGGGVNLFKCDATLVDTWFDHNHASSSGGALYVQYGNLTWTGGGASYNTAAISGGAVVLQSAIAELRNVGLHHNLSESVASAVLVQYLGSDNDANVWIDNSTITGNRGVLGTVHRSGLQSVPLEITDTLFLNNTTYAFYDAIFGNPDLVMHHNAWWDNQNDVGPITTLSTDLTDVLADPRLVAYDASPTDDYHLRDHSPLRDAGHEQTDPDGTATDIGQYGGSNAPVDWNEYYRDLDADMVADGWELEYGLDPSDSVDASIDHDGDTIATGLEFMLKTDPFAVDSDLDGVVDPSEVSGGTNPTDPADFAPSADAGGDITVDVGNTALLTGSGIDPQAELVSYRWTLLAAPGRSVLTTSDLVGADTDTVSFVPDFPGTYEVQLVTSDGVGFSLPDTAVIFVPGPIRVPEDYPTVKEAAIVAESGGAILIGPGTFPVTLDMNEKDLTLIGAGQNATFLDGGHLAPVITARRGESITLSGLTLTRGLGGRGGGLWVDDGAADLDDVAVTECRASNGGGIYLDTSPLTAIDLLVADNVSGYLAGGLSANASSTVDILNSTIVGNSAPGGVGNGGGIRISASDLTLTNAIISDNFASQGGGIYLTGTGTTAFLDHITATANGVFNNGGFLTVGISAQAEIHNSVIAHSSGQSSIYEDGSAISLTQTYTLFTDNEGGYLLNLSEEPVTGVDGNIIDGEADLAGFIDDSDWTNDVWTLGSFSEAIDAADPLSSLDPDGSAPDMGAFGGADGAWLPF